jgi:tRNA (adenine37-N6)-methyltransferase
VPQNWEKSVELRPLGYVVSDMRDFAMEGDREFLQAESQVVIREDLSEALIGLEQFSHVFVLYYQHRREEWVDMVGWGKPGEPILKLPLQIPFVTEPIYRGILTTRAPARPSGIGLSVVELVKREGTVLTLRGLDAVDGTPVLDVKPYMRFDAVPDAKMPALWRVEQIEELIEAARRLHWGVMNVGLALGLRAGLRAMLALHLNRREPTACEVTGSYCFAQGIEVMTGCSVLRETMIFHRSTEGSEWRGLRLAGRGQEIELRQLDREFSGPDEVMSTHDGDLFKVSEVKPQRKEAAEG